MSAIKTTQVNNSLVYLKLKDNSHSRTLKTIPTQDSNSFLVGASQNQNAYIIKVLYDDENKKLSSSDIVEFNNINEENNIINDIIDIYPQNETNFLVQIFNYTKNQHELFQCQYNNEENKYKLSPIQNGVYKGIFDVNNFQNSSSKINIINHNKVNCLDMNNNSIIGDIKLYDDDYKANPIKISSDIPLIESSILSIGINRDIFICDVHNMKINTHIKEAHSNAVLSIQQDPLNQFLLCSSGTDYSLKFWDTRKTDIPIATIDDNSHWVWSCKYNNNYSNVLVTASSSSLVRNIIFGKKEELLENNEEGRTGVELDKKLDEYSYVDYYEFEDSVYVVDWLCNDSWTFAAVSYNSYFHINKIPEDVKYKIMI